MLQEAHRTFYLKEESALWPVHRTQRSTAVQCNSNISHIGVHAWATPVEKPIMKYAMEEKMLASMTERGSCTRLMDHAYALAV